MLFFQFYEPMTGFEPVTSSLQGSALPTELRRQLSEDRDRTDITSLEGWGSTIELHSRTVGRNSNLRRHTRQVTVCPLAAASPQSYFQTKTPSHREDSNLRPTDYKSVALPAELRWHNTTKKTLLLKNIFKNV